MFARAPPIRKATASWNVGTVRLHSAIGYVTPADCLAGLSEVIGEERDRKLEAARKQRQEKRAAAKQVA